MQETLVKCWEMLRHQFLFVPAGAVIEDIDDYGIDLVISYSDLPIRIIPPSIVEPFHVGGCI